MEKIKSSVGYVRVSTSQQAETGTSVDDQKLRIKNKSDGRGYNFVKYYSDEGISGKSTERPSLKQMLQDAKKGKFDVIIFTKLDRLARNLRDTLNIYHEIKDLGVDMVCIDDPYISTDGRMGTVMLNILGTFAEFERDMIRSRTTAGRMIKWRSGESIIGSLPFGYIKNSTTNIVEIDNENMNIIEKIYNLYIIERLSMVDLAKHLTSEGISTPSFLKGKKIYSTQWSMNTVREILTNIVYTGEPVVYNKKIYAMSNNNNLIKTKDKKSEVNWVQKSFPMIIDRKMFDDAQARIKHNKTVPKKTNIDISEKVLTLHLLRCGECSAKMSKIIRSKNDKILYTCYWRKSSKKRLESGNRNKCTLPYYDHEIIDDQVFYKIIDFITDPCEFANLFRKNLDDNDLTIKITALEKDKTKFLNEITRFSSIEATADDEELYNLYRGKREEAELKFKDIKTKLSYYNNQLLFDKKNNEQIDNFQKIFSLNTLGDAIKAKIKIKKMLLDWPNAEKKKLIDAVISPETGGCVYVSRFSEHNLAPDDFIVSSDLPAPNDAPSDHLVTTKEPSSNENIVIELDFLLDPHRHSLIIQDVYKKLFNIDGSKPTGDCLMLKCPLLRNNGLICHFLHILCHCKSGRYYQ